MTQIEVLAYNPDMAARLSYKERQSISWVDTFRVTFRVGIGFYMVIVLLALLESLYGMLIWLARSLDFSSLLSWFPGSRSPGTP